MLPPRTAAGLLWFAALFWGVWFGGQLFNALMVVPYFTSDLPRSLHEWGQLRHSNLADFFLIFNTLWIFLALALALLVGRGKLGRALPWAVASAITALISVGFVLGWMAPTISRLSSPDSGGLAIAEVRRLLQYWTAANWVRLVVEAFGFVSAIAALSLVPRNLDVRMLGEEREAASPV